jgi:hypothetical protein
MSEYVDGASRLLCDGAGRSVFQAGRNGTPPHARAIVAIRIAGCPRNHHRVLGSIRTDSKLCGFHGLHLLWIDCLLCLCFSKRSPQTIQTIRTPGHPFTTLLFIAACWLVVINTIIHYPSNTLNGMAILVQAYRDICFGEEVTKMNVRGQVMSSEYMHWAKTSSQARFNLATSGLLI